MRALLSATFLLTTLLFTAHQASAAPPTATDPPDLLTPTNPPEPQPCQAWPVPCDLPLPTLTADTPTTEPAPPSSTTSTTSTTSTSTRQAPTSTATDDGTAAGPGRTTSPVNRPAEDGTNWWLLTIPILALLALAAAGTVLLVQRSERRPH